MSKLDEAKRSLFSISSTNKHSTDKDDLEPGQHVEFRGSGAVIAVTYEGFADEEKVPTRLYKITCDSLELDE